MIDAIILAGGLGTRLREIVPDVPKPLAAIGNRPFLDLLLERTFNAGIISKAILAIGYKADIVIDYYRTTKWPLLFSIEQELLGTGGAVLFALNQVKSDVILVLNGDTFLEIDFLDMLTFHMEKKSILTLALTKQEGDRYGEVEFDLHQKIVGFREKGMEKGKKWISGGCYLINKDAFLSYPRNKIYSLEKDIFPDFIGKEAFAYKTEGKFIDIGTKESYMEAQTYL